MKKGVIIIRKRSIATFALILLIGALVHRFVGYKGVWSIALFSSAATMFIVLAAWWAREKFEAPQNPYHLAKNTRALIDNLVHHEIDSWVAYRHALLTHRYAYVRYLRRIGAVNVKLYPYVAHIDACLKNKTALTMDFPDRSKNVVVPHAPVAADGFYLD